MLFGDNREDVAVVVSIGECRNRGGVLVIEPDRIGAEIRAEVRELDAM